MFILDLKLLTKFKIKVVKDNDEKKTFLKQKQLLNASRVCHYFSFQIMVFSDN